MHWLDTMTSDAGFVWFCEAAGSKNGEFVESVERETVATVAAKKPLYMSLSRNNRQQ